MLDDTLADFPKSSPMPLSSAYPMLFPQVAVRSKQETANKSRQTQLQHVSEHSNRLITSLRKEVTSLKKTNADLTSKFHNVMASWRGSLSKSFGVDCVYANDMSVEQYRNMRNMMSNEFVDERWRRQRIPGTGF